MPRQKVVFFCRLLMYGSKKSWVRSLNKKKNLWLTSSAHRHWRSTLLSAIYVFSGGKWIEINLHLPTTWREAKEGKEVVLGLAKLCPRLGNLTLEYNFRLFDDLEKEPGGGGRGGGEVMFDSSDHCRKWSWSTAWSTSRSKFVDLSIGLRMKSYFDIQEPFISCLATMFFDAFKQWSVLRIFFFPSLFGCSCLLFWQ